MTGSQRKHSPKISDSASYPAYVLELETARGHCINQTFLGDARQPALAFSCRECSCRFHTIPSLM